MRSTALRHRALAQLMIWLLRKFPATQSLVSFIHDLTGLAGKNMTILEGSNYYAPSLPYSAQVFYTKTDVLRSWTMEDTEITSSNSGVHHQEFFSSMLWAYLCNQVNQNLEKFANERRYTPEAINRRLSHRNCRYNFATQMTYFS